MPNFSYLALNRQGLEISGRLAAADARSAAATLRQNGLRVIDVAEMPKPGGGTGLRREIDLAALMGMRSVPTQQLIFFYRQLAFMLRAGLPVTQALQLAQTQLSGGRLNQVIRQMIADIESGSSLSQALAAHPKVFSALAVNLVVAGESTGELDVIVERLAAHLEKRSVLRGQTISALIYPTIVVLAAIGVGIFLVTKIIPKFGQFLASQGRALPPSTQFLIDFSTAVTTHGGAILLVLACAIAAALAIYRMPPGRLAIDRLLLRLPVIGNLLMNGSMAQLAWGLSMLLRSGITVYDALKIASGLLGNRVLSNRLTVAAEMILGGRDLAGSLRDPLVPILLTRMVAVGETTGTLDRVLQELGTFYERALETGIKRLSAMVEPALILVIGGMVGFVYFAFFQAMFQIASRG